MSLNHLSIAGLVREPPQDGAAPGQWQRTAPFLAPLVTVGVLALATLVMYVSCGAALI